jgi:hypothetical protein
MQYGRTSENSSSRNCLENSWRGMDCVFLVAQSGDKDASGLVMSTRRTPECRPFGFSKQFL